MRRPLGVIFDLGGTILQSVSTDWTAGTQRLLELAEDGHGYTAASLEPVSGELVRELFAFREKSQIELRYEDYVKLLCETTGISLRVSYPEAVREMWNAALRFEPTAGAREVLDKLAPLGIRMGVLSNSSFSGRLLKEELEKHDLARFFTFVISSADYGVRKPNPRLTALALAKLGLNANDVWFVGDLADIDVAAALKAGLSAVWYNPQGKRLPDGYSCMEVGHWREFGERVDWFYGVDDEVA